MKKSLAIVLVMAIAMVGVFALSGDTLILTSSVSGGFQVGFSSAEISTYAASYEKAVTAPNNKIEDKNVTNYYLYAGTNNKAKYDIFLAATQFQNVDTSITTKYGYTLTINGVTLNTATGNVDATKIWILDNTTGSGPKAESKKFESYSVDDAGKALAAEGDYEATLTVTIDVAS